MPHSHPDAPALAFDDVDAAIDRLRDRGLRVSAARRLVLEALFLADGPVSAERIAGGFDGRLSPQDLGSVYRNLQTFEVLGLVRHVHVAHGPGLYALAGGQPREFLVCEACGAVADVAPADLDEVRDLIRRSFGYEVRFSHFPLTGLCSDCADVRTHRH